MNPLTALMPTHAMFVQAATVADRSADTPVRHSQISNPEISYLPRAADPPRDIPGLDRASYLQKRIAEFQLAKFATQTLDAKLAHMSRELAELREQPNDILEWADVFILLLGSAACAGLTVSDLIAAAHIKMDINERRTWTSQPDHEGVYHHTSH